MDKGKYFKRITNVDLDREIDSIKKKIESLRNLRLTILTSLKNFPLRLKRRVSVGSLRFLDSEIKRLEERLYFLEVLRSRISGFTDREIENFKKDIKNLKAHFKTFKYMYRTKRKKAIDEFLFSLEDIPPIGKEYWFMLFTSFDSTQIVTTFGRYNNKFTFNDCVIDGRRNSGDRLEGACTVWYFNEGKHEIPTYSGELKVKKNQLSCVNSSLKIEFEGKYPNYRLSLSEDGEEFCNLKLVKLGHGKTSEFDEFFKGMFGYQLLNLYFSYSGTLRDKKISGRCYLQKVVVVGPFLPWKWGRINFENDYVFTYFSVKLEGLGLKKKLINYAKLYDSKRDETLNFEEIEVKNFGEGSRWLIEATSPNKKLMLFLKTYCVHPFTFRSKGSWSYNEHFVEVLDFLLEGEKNLDLSSLGKGFGLVEDSRGFII